MSNDSNPLKDVPVIEMPPMPKEAFDSEEDYQRAVETSKAAHTGDPGSAVFIPEDRLIEVFMALVNAKHAVGMGVLHDRDMDRLQAVEMLKKQGAFTEETRKLHFDYVNGRPVKLKPLERVEGGWQFHSDLYNRDDAGAAERVVAGVLEGSS